MHYISNWRQHGWRFFTIQQLLLVNLIDLFLLEHAAQATKQIGRVLVQSILL